MRFINIRVVLLLLALAFLGYAQEGMSRDTAQDGRDTAYFEVAMDRELGDVGKHLVGMHFVYDSEKDAIYSNGAIAQWAKKAGISVARYPGGTVVQYWDWRNPTGVRKMDPWGGGSVTPVDASQWMSIDEYLKFIAEAGIKPLVGINILSGVKHDKIGASIQRAVDEVKYVMSKGYPGAFYYLGNEDIHELGGVERAAAVFLQHARAIKAVDPAAKLFWNDNFVNPKRLVKFLSIVGGYADGVEFHGKWPSGADRTAGDVTLQDWQDQYPIREQKRGMYSERVAELRRAAAGLGFPNFMFANNEYGLSQLGDNHFKGFNRFHYSLVVLDILQDLFIGRFDMAAFWPSTTLEESAEGSDKDKKKLIDTSHGNKLNPMHFGFEMLSSAQGMKMLALTGNRVDAYGFAAKSRSELDIFLMNKSSHATNVNIKIQADRTAVSATKWTLKDTADGWGEVVEAQVPLEQNRLTTTLPAMSYTKFVIR